MPIFHFKTNNILHQISRISHNNVVRYMVRAYGRTRELIIFLILFFGFFIGLSIKMTLPNMLNTFMNTAYKLLIDTVFYIMAITVMTGAISKLFVEFGVVVLLELRHVPPQTRPPRFLRMILPEPQPPSSPRTRRPRVRSARTLRATLPLRGFPPSRCFPPGWRRFRFPPPRGRLPGMRRGTKAGRGRAGWV